MNAVNRELESTKNALECSRTDLVKSESVWNDEKKSLIKELETVKDERARREDELKNLRVAVDGLSNQMTTQLESFVSNDQPQGQLADLIKFMRRDREIEEGRCDLLTSENNTLKSRLSYLERELEVSRTTIRNLESKASKVMNQDEYQALLSKVKEMNLLRESNETLRSISERRREENESLRASLSQAQDSLQNATLNLTSVVNERDNYKSDVAGLKIEKDRLEIRIQRLLEARERIDPSVLEETKKSRDDALADVTKLRAQVQDLSAKVNQITTEATDRENALEDKIVDLENSIEEHQNTIKDLSTKEANYNKKVNDLSRQLAECKTIISSRDAEVTELKAAAATHVIDAATTAEMTEMKDKLIKYDKQLNELVKASKVYRDRILRLSQENKNLEARCSTSNLSVLQNEVIALEHERDKSNDRQRQFEATESNLRDELTKVEGERSKGMTKINNLESVLKDVNGQLAQSERLRKSLEIEFETTKQLHETRIAKLIESHQTE